MGVKGALFKASSISPAVAQGRGRVRRITSEKLSPGSLSLRNLACASVEIVIVVKGMHENCMNSIRTQGHF
jgi:hypothetical protein